MILEGIVTTLAPDGTLNVAPMGPKLARDPTRFVLRPYKTSTTYRNLKSLGEGVLHVTDDVLLIARAAIGMLPRPESRPASMVRGEILQGIAGRYHEFRVVDLQDQADRTTILIESVREGQLDRPLFGLNRAKHAVIEAAILATRLEFLPRDEILADFARLVILVEKTGGPDERLAFGFLADHVQAVAGVGSRPPRDIDEETIASAYPPQDPLGHVEDAGGGPHAPEPEQLLRLHDGRV